MKCQFCGKKGLRKRWYMLEGQFWNKVCKQFLLAGCAVDESDDSWEEE